jgi:hypothetical protein
VSEEVVVVEGRRPRRTAWSAGEIGLDLVDGLAMDLPDDVERGEVRVRQTTEVRGAVADLLGRLGVTPPHKLHTVEAASAPSNTTDPA